jgi:uncharacterized membrane protein YkvA (DUF1232 family)
MMDDHFSRRFSAEDIAAMRRLAADEDGLGRRLLALLKRAARSAPFAEDAVAAWHCARDPATPARVRVILMSALAYFVLPVDALPDLVPLLGFTDDAAVIAAAIATVASELKPEHREKARHTLDALAR